MDSHPPNNVSIYQSVTSLLWTHIHQTMSAYTSLSRLCCGLSSTKQCQHIPVCHNFAVDSLWTRIHQTTSASTSLSQLCCGLTSTKQCQHTCGLTSTKQCQHIPVCHDFAVDHETTPACTLAQRQTHRRLVVLQPDAGHSGEGSEAPGLEEVNAEGVFHQARAPPDLVVQRTEI